jgi:phage shock protein PspC (stress-responsive transcriptional regulator)
MSVPETHPAPLRRDRSRGIVGGVCAGLAARLGVDAWLLRFGFAAATLFGGLGVALYVLAWLVLPAGASDPARTRPLLARVAGRRESWMVAAGLVCLLVAGLLLLRQWGLWVGDAFVWPLVLAAGGGALIWRQSQGAAAVPAAGPATEARRRRRLLARPSLGAAAVGAALVVGGGLVFLWLNGALVAARDVVLAVVVVVVGLTIILAPWWLRLVRGLDAERAERIRSQERAELAAHLHDSVLQTLALMQKRAQDPREVAALARRQERELRSWLNAPGGRRGR